MIITGVLLINVGVKCDPQYEKILGTMIITFGSINLLFELMRLKFKK